MNKKEDCKQKNFDGCVNVCRKAGEGIENCINVCSVAVKQLCSDKTKLSVGTKNFNTHIETESNVKGWVLIIAILIIILLLVWKFVL